MKSVLKTVSISHLFAVTSYVEPHFYVARWTAIFLFLCMSTSEFEPFHC